MIGLGNGRKRSKKYEDFVLDKRAKLREEYFLCEKAAQKLLGYSINFLYKKLRTNPEVGCKFCLQCRVKVRVIVTMARFVPLLQWFKFKSNFTRLS